MRGEIEFETLNPLHESGIAGLEQAGVGSCRLQRLSRSADIDPRQSHEARTAEPESGHPVSLSNGGNELVSVADLQSILVLHEDVRIRSADGASRQDHTGSQVTYLAAAASWLTARWQHN